MAKDLNRHQKSAILVVTFLAIAATIFGLSTASNRLNDKELSGLRPDNTASAANKSVLAEKVVKVGNYEIKLHSVSRTDTYSEFYLSVTNTSQNIIQFSPNLQFTLYDKTTQKLVKSYLPNNQQLFVGGPLGSGMTQSGKIYFAVPKTNNIELDFAADLGSDQKFNIY